MRARVENQALPAYKVQITWEEANPKDDSETAKTVKDVVAGLNDAVKGLLISHQSAADFLRQFVPTALPYVLDTGADDEQSRIQAEQEALQAEQLRQAEEKARIEAETAAAARQAAQPAVPQNGTQGLVNGTGTATLVVAKSNGSTN
jgi:hypothetical protein